MERLQIKRIVGHLLERASVVLMGSNFVFDDKYDPRNDQHGISASADSGNFEF
jgi:hypothetical protein